VVFLANFSACAEPDEAENWQVHSAEMRHSLNMAPDETPWVQSHTLAGVPSTARHLELLKIAYWAWKVERKAKYAHLDCGTSASPRWICDLSQGVERKPWAPWPGMIGQKSVVYLFDRDRVMTVEEH
jgi:hypothetical protein